MAQVHFIGSILGCEDFHLLHSGLCCHWQFVKENEEAWQLLQGDEIGASQIDISKISNDVSVWSHPIDVHYTTTSVQGWPKIVFQVFKQDSSSNFEIVSYGYISLPMSPGKHFLTCPTWRPVGNYKDELSKILGGNQLQLGHLNVIHQGNERHKFVTETMGSIHLEITVLTRNFETHGIVWS